jgi:hypothetical protein
MNQNATVERKTIAHPDFLFWFIKKNYNIKKEKED